MVSNQIVVDTCNLSEGLFVPFVLPIVGHGNKLQRMLIVSCLPAFGGAFEKNDAQSKLGLRRKKNGRRKHTRFQHLNSLPIIDLDACRSLVHGFAACRVLGQSLQLVDSIEVYRF